MMELVTSIEQLQTMPAEIRSLRKGFVTNFYLDPIKHSMWIAKGDCYVERIEETLFITKQSPNFWNVFYCSTSLEHFASSLRQFQKEHLGKTMMFDVVGREVQCQPMVSILQECGCKEATSLVRMTRMTEPVEYEEDATVKKVAIEDVGTIHQLLHQFFDEKTEQIPYLEELEDYAQQGLVLICKEESRMAGFLVYEINATTLYLRYWFTHPDFRDKKVGSRLLRRFFEEGKYTKRQLFWVIRSNENAIKRYRHYGFAEENMYDYVMRYN